MEGTVKWFNRTKGYGFIAGDDGSEFFVHSSALAQGTFIRENDKVSFDAVDSEKGKQAQNVTLLEKGSERTDVAEEAPAEEAPAEEAPAEEAPAEEAPAEEAPAEEAAPEENTE